MSITRLTACIIYYLQVGMMSSKVINSWNALDKESFFNKPIPEHCGRSRDEFHNLHRSLPFDFNTKNKRIVGGLLSAEGEWPWLVSLMLQKDEESGFEHLCGGTLIDRQWVVTAAHCFEPVWAEFLTSNPEKWIVRVGEHDLFDEKTTHLDIQPEKIFLPPNRDPLSTISMDIALVKLSEPVKFQSYINVACLPRHDDRVPDGSYCVTAGWGHTVEGGKNISSVVRHVQVPVINNEICNKLFENIDNVFKLEIPDDMMCAGFDDGGKDACQYDSGGPMVCFDEDSDQWLLSGVVSLGYGCARAGYPGIYTRVSNYVNWIEATVGSM